ncbi:hypothetical protein MASR2M18_08070 [Ignavibacteria bacterium]
MNFTLSDNERRQLEIFRRNVGSRAEYVKTTILLMSDKSVPADKIANYLGVDSGMVYRYVERYRFLGLEKYLATNYQGYSGRLSDAVISALRSELNSKLYSDRKTAKRLFLV